MINQLLISFYHNICSRPSTKKGIINFNILAAEAYIKRSFYFSVSALPQKLSASLNSGRSFRYLSKQESRLLEKLPSNLYR